MTTTTTTTNTMTTSLSTTSFIPTATAGGRPIKQQTTIKMFMDSYRKNAHSLWAVLFRLEGNILLAVLPFCVINCMVS
jgi:hypothetical protein